jgi:ribose-phosphate pyrophosphokinase
MILKLNDENSKDFTISRFPDGQQSVTINIHIPIDKEDQYVIIHSHLNSFLDLELILSATSALRELGFKDISLYIPYFLGARSDRKFIKGSSNYLKTVICPIINSQNYDQVMVVDAHSDVLEACLNNYYKIDNISLVKFALERIDNKRDAHQRITLVSPDAGALKKVYDVAAHFSLENIIIANKHRDIRTGKITHTEVPGLPDAMLDSAVYPMNFVIIDDICDGGRTFIEIAKVIKEKRPNGIYREDKIYLIVTHGIFSGGYDLLSEYFDQIFCTNSVKDIIDNDLITQQIII